MDNGIIIRDATRNDYPAICEVHRLTWIATYTSEEYGITKQDIIQHFEARYRSEDPSKADVLFSDPDIWHFWVAIDGGRVVGFTDVEKKKCKAQGNAIYVLPGYQGRGIGRALLEKAWNWPGEELDFFTEIVEYNIRMLKIHEKHGFLPTGMINQQKIGDKSIPLVELVRKSKKQHGSTS